MRRRRYVTIGVCVGLIGLGAAGAWAWLQPRNTAYSVPTQDTLEAISAETNDVLRTLRLANWARDRAPDEIITILRRRMDLFGENDVRPDTNFHIALVGIGCARLAELYPQETAQQIQERFGRLLFEADSKADAAKASESSVAGTIDEAAFLSTVRADPVAGLDRCASLRIHPNDRARLRIKILAQVATLDLHRAMALLASRSDVPRGDAISAITEAAFPENPRARLQFVAALPPSAGNTDLMRSILSEWSRTNPGFALEAAAALPNTFGLGDELNAILQRWIKEAPDASVTWLTNSPPADAKTLGAAIAALAPTHPQFVAENLLGRVALDARAGQAATLVKGWMSKDPAACLAWVGAQPFSDVSLSAAREAAGSLARTDPAAAVALLDKLPCDVNRSHVIAAIGANLQPRSAALAWLAGQPDSKAANEVFAAHLERAVGDDPQALLVLASKFPSEAKRAAAYGVAGEAWFQKDRAAAVAWMRSLSDRAQLSEIIKRVGDPWALAAPREAADFATQLKDGEAFNTLVSKVGEVWRQRDPFAAAEWLSRQTDTGPVRSEIFRAFSAAAAHDVTRVRPILAAMPPEQLRLEAFYGAINGLVKTNPRAAADLVATTADPVNDGRVFNTLGETWSALDVNAATAWATALPPGKARDSAVRGTLKNVTAADPAGALRLAESTSAEERDNAARIVVSAWYRREPERALAAVSASTVLSEKAKAWIIETIAKGR